MCVFYYRAYDQSGIERHGVIDAPDEQAADRRLRRTGLKPFFIGDYAKVRLRAARKKSRKKQRQRVWLYVAGGLSIAGALWFSSFIVAYAGREQAPDIQQYQSSGVLQGANKIIYGDTPETRAFAREMALLWREYAPDTLSGIECTRYLLTAYVTESVAEVAQEDIELLTVQILKAQKRRFDVAAPMVLIVQDETPMLEATYLERYNAVDIVYYD